MKVLLIHNIVSIYNFISLILYLKRNFKKYCLKQALKRNQSQNKWPRISVSFNCFVVSIHCSFAEVDIKINNKISNTWNLLSISKERLGSQGSQIHTSIQACFLPEKSHDLGDIALSLEVQTQRSCSHLLGLNWEESHDSVITASGGRMGSMGQARGKMLWLSQGNVLYVCVGKGLCPVMCSFWQHHAKRRAH